MKTLATSALLCCVLAATIASGEERHDLIAAFPTSDLLHSVGHLDPGSPDAEPHLLDGWATRVNQGGRSRWGLGDSSALSIFFANPRAFTLVARGRWFEVEDAATPTVELSINGRAARASDKATATEFRWTIPVDALMVGHNELRFRYSHHRARPPQRLDSESTERTADLRELAMAWERFELTGIEATRPPALEDPDDSKPRALAIPSGSRIDYFLRLRAQDGRANAEPVVLEFASLEPLGSGPERLRVELVADATDATSVADAPFELGFEHVADGQPGRIAIPIPDDFLASGGVLRLSLGVASSMGVDGGLRLGAPTLLGAAVEMPLLASQPALGRNERAAEESVGDESGDAERGRAEPARPNVLLYVVDTLRSDHLGAYGYTRPTSPRFDAWSRDATLFENAYANSSWTRPSTASILTGLDPFAHRVIGSDDGLPAEAETLAERLSEAGYVTAAWVTNPNVSQAFGFQQGFESFEFLAEDLGDPAIFASAHDLNAAVKPWFETRDESRPYFLYLHATDPHSPYVPTPEYRDRLAAEVGDPSIGRREFVKRLGELRREGDPELVSDLIALYDAEIAAVDAAFGSLLDFLRTQGELANTLVVFTSDHGEEFFEHQWWGHGKTLFEEQLRIPLVIAYPEGTVAPSRVSGRAEHVDLMPLVLDALGLPVPADIQGYAGLPASGRPPENERPVLARFERGNRSAQSVVYRGAKLIRYDAYAHPFGERPVTQLYDLQRDPDEKENLARSRPVMAGYLRSLLRSADRRSPRLVPAHAEADLSIEKRLRALGYIQ